MRKDSKSYTVLFAFLITFVFIFILSILNASTVKQVTDNERLFKIKAILNAFGIDFKDDGEALRLFSEKIEIKQIDKVELYTTSAGDQRFYGIVFRGNGLWSTITGFLAVDEKVERITGLEFISQAETPGLGGRIEESWFKDQFRSEKIVDGVIRVKSGTGDFDHENGEVDAITGATQTSRSVEKIINEHLELLRRVVEVN
ncbi:FMN-binding protein [Pseudothermotoga sp. U03pept]|uniref:FMN-binding protein n=1 Tax=Pseudothermotoga sp. U03pept TaxID=3447012 RepID=UPI003F01F839